MLILGRVEFGHFTCGSGLVGSNKLDPRPTLNQPSLYTDHVIWHIYIVFCFQHRPTADRNIVVNTMCIIINNNYTSYVLNLWNNVSISSGNAVVLERSTSTNIDDTYSFSQDRHLYQPRLELCLGFCSDSISLWSRWKLKTDQYDSASRQQLSHVSRGAKFFSERLIRRYEYLTVTCAHARLSIARVCAYWLRGTVGWTLVSDRRTFLVLRSTCSWWVTIYVGKSSA